MIADFFSYVIRNLSKRKLRSWLTMIGIFVSIATIFALVSISVGLQNAVQEQFRMLGSDKFFVMPLGQLGAPGTGGAVKLTTEDVKVIEKVRGVKLVTYASIGNAQVEFEKQTRYFMVVGFPLDQADLYIETGAFKADEGRLLKQGDRGKIMVGSDYKYSNVFKKPVHSGDKFILNGKEFEIVGILAPIGNPSDDKNIYLSFDDFKELFNSGDRVDQIVAQIQAGENIDEVSARAKQRLMNHRDVTEKTIDFSISTPEELLRSFGAILNIITGFLVGVAAISLLVGAIGIANTMYTSTLERTREIGVMKAIGAKNSDILTIFLIESGMLGMVGGVIGVLLGIGISKIIEIIAVQALGTNLLKAAFPVYLIIGCLAFSFLIGALSGILPAWQASKQKPVDSLRYE